MMRSLSSSKGLVDVVETILEDAFYQCLTQAKAIKDALKRDIAQIDKYL